MNRMFRYLRIYFWISVGISIVFLYLFARSFTPRFPEISMDRYFHTTKTFFVSPERLIPTYDLIVVEPHVSTSPKNVKYSLVLWNEQFDRMVGKHTALFFASKRVSELLKWPQELLVQKTTPTFQELKNTYDQFVVYSWENIAGRYIADIEQAVEAVNASGPKRFQELSEIKVSVLSHKNQLMDTIVNSSLPDEETAYLAALFEDIFRNLLQEIDPMYFREYPNEVLYDLRSLTVRKEQGLFDASFNVSDVPEVDQNQLKLHVNANNVVERSVENAGDGASFLKYPNVLINHPDRNTLVLSDFQPRDIVAGSWEAVHSNDGFHRYRLPLTPVEENRTYLLKIKHNFTRDTNLNAYEVSQERRDILNTILRHNNGRPVEYINYLVFTVTAQQGQAYIELVNKQGIPDQELAASQVHVQTIYEPYLQLNSVMLINTERPSITKKKEDSSYILTVDNTYLSQDEYILSVLRPTWTVVDKQTISPSRYQLTVIPRTSLHLIVLLVLNWVIFSVIYISSTSNLRHSLMHRMVKAVRVIFDRMYNAMIAIVRMLTLVWLILLLLVIFLDVSRGYVISNGHLIATLVLSLLTLYTLKRLASILLFVSTTGLFFACLLMQMTGYTLPILKLASYGLIFFISGLIYHLVYFYKTD